MTELPWFRELQNAQLAHFAKDSGGYAKWLRENDRVHLFGTIGSDGVLAPDGTVTVTQFDEYNREAARTAEGVDRIGALVLGSRRWPQLATLLPQREADSVVCQFCAGRGEAVARIICHECGGLGWVAPPAI